MKITVLPTGNAPEFYTFSGEVVTANYKGESESFDLSPVATGDVFKDVTVDTLDLPTGHIIRDVYRDEAGELHFKVCQKVGAGHWLTGAEFDTTAYNPEAIYAVYDSNKEHSGVATVTTSKGVLSWA
jgi:hypothetical protein